MGPQSSWFDLILQGNYIYSELTKILLILTNDFQLNSQRP